MKNWYYIKLFAVISVHIAQLLFTRCIAQNVITASSGFYETPAMSLSWTIGEIAVETYINNDIIITQGFNQSNLTITDITEDLSPLPDISVYPNPVKDIFSIKAITNNPVRFTAELYDLSGVKLITEDINNNNTQINIEKLPESVYILRIYANRQVMKTFRIIKTD